MSHRIEDHMSHIKCVGYKGLSNDPIIYLITLILYC